MRINGIDFDPATNPAVLDTCTWDEPAASQQCRSIGSLLERCTDTAGTTFSNDFQDEMLQSAGVRCCAVPDSTPACCILRLPDGQRVLVVAGAGEVARGRTLYESCRTECVVLPVNTESVKWLVTQAAQSFAPRALGPVPRLGIGGRQTETVWPGIIEAMRVTGGAAETIQNSAFRELAPMSSILSPPGGEAAYLPGHGTVEIGHTGSSIEGFWLAGVLSHIENNAGTLFGADLDHVPVKSSDDAGLARAKTLIDCGQHYTFYTLDTSFLFDFSTPDVSGRYDTAIDAAVEIHDYIRRLKNGDAFDFEFSMDEGPQITEAQELRYVLDQLRRKGVGVTFIAPNVGFEKRVDYRKPDGLPGLEARVKEMAAVAEEYGAVLDFHSGSDKSTNTYRTISRAARGRLKLKVSGKLQLILAEVLADLAPEFFNEWWDYTLSTAKEEARRASAVAADFVDLVEQRRTHEGSQFKRSPRDRFFADFSFGMVGARDEDGRLIHRHRFYALSPAVREEYTRRIVHYLVRMTEDLELRSE